MDGAPEPEKTNHRPDVTAPSPTVARRRLGGELRRLREQAGLTLVEVGRRLERSQATMSRLEKGATPARAVDVEKMLDIYRDEGVSEAETVRADLLGLLGAGREKEWFSPFQDVLAGDMTRDHVETFMGYETNADRMLSYEPDVIPGLLQTASYAAAVIEASLTEHTDRQRERLIELRMERGERLRRLGRPRLDVVLGDLALLRQFPGPEAMIEQLQAVAREIRDGSPGITIRIVPSTLALSAATGGPFVVMYASDPGDDDVVYLEHRTGESYLTDETMVANYAAQFTALVDASLSDDQALERLDEVIKQIT